jgi:hypothetical protein
MQAHEAGGEHLRVHAIVAPGAVSQRRGHHVRYGANARLQSAAIVHETQSVAGDRPVQVGRFRIGQRIGLTVGLHQDVDEIHRQRVVVIGREAPSPGQVGIDLDQKDPVGVGAGQNQFVARGTEMQ